MPATQNTMHNSRKARQHKSHIINLTTTSTTPSSTLMRYHPHHQQQQLVTALVAPHIDVRLTIMCSACCYSTFCLGIGDVAFVVLLLMATAMHNMMISIVMVMMMIMTMLMMMTMTVVMTVKAPMMRVIKNMIIPMVMRMMNMKTARKTPRWQCSEASLTGSWWHNSNRKFAGRRIVRERERASCLGPLHLVNRGRADLTVMNVFDPCEGVARVTSRRTPHHGNPDLPYLVRRLTILSRRSPPPFQHKRARRKQKNNSDETHTGFILHISKQLSELLADRAGRCSWAFPCCGNGEDVPVCHVCVRGYTCIYTYTCISICV